MIIKTTKIRGLNSLRFIAFFCVFLSHSTPLLPWGSYGIDLFFVLSSFLLTYLALIEIQLTGKFSAKSFFIRRSLRLYPLYFAVLSASFLLLPLMENVFKISVSLPQKKFLYFLFLSNYDNNDHIFALKFLWTISVEEQFYLLFILFSVFFKRNFYVPITLFYLLYLIGNIGGQIFHWNHYTLTTTYFPHFAGGMIAANLYLKNKVPPLKVLLIFVVLSLALSMAFQHYSTLKFYTQIPISVLITSIILFTAKSFNTYSINNAITKTTEYLGKYTYGLYVYSGFVLTFFIKFYPWSDTWYKFALQCIILFVVARFSYHYFEVFFIRLKQHFQPLSPKTEKQAK